jgi:hypothetical protein
MKSQKAKRIILHPDEKRTYALVLLGVMKPYFVSDRSFNEKMQEYYLLKARTEMPMPDLDWELKMLEKD